MAEVPKQPRYFPLFPDAEGPRSNLLASLDQGVHGEGVLEQSPIADPAGDFAQQMQQMMYQQPQFPMQQQPMMQPQPDPNFQPYHPMQQVGQAAMGMQGPPVGAQLQGMQPQPPMMDEEPPPGGPYSRGPIGRLADFLREKYQSVTPQSWYNQGLMHMAAQNPQGAANFMLQNQQYQAQQRRRQEDLAWREEGRQQAQEDREDRRKIQERIQFANEYARLQKQLAGTGLWEKAIDILGREPETMDDLISIREITRDEHAFQTLDNDYSELLHDIVLRGVPNSYVPEKYKSLPEWEERFNQVNDWLAEKNKLEQELKESRNRIAKVRADTVEGLTRLDRARISNLQRQARQLESQMAQNQAQINRLTSGSKMEQLVDPFWGRTIDQQKRLMAQHQAALLEIEAQISYILDGDEYIPDDKDGSKREGETETPEPTGDDPFIKAMSGY